MLYSICIKVGYFIWRKKALVCATSITSGCCIFYLVKNAPIDCQDLKESKKQSNNEHSSYIYLPQLSNNSLAEANKFWIPCRKYSTPLYLKLLQLSKSKHPDIRYKAVQALSELFDLEKWQFRVIAQACDAQTAVSLARIIKSSPLLFLPPPFKDLEEKNLNEELRLFLLSLPYMNAQFCVQLLIKHAQSAANSLMKYENTWYSEMEDHNRIYHSLQKAKVILSFHKICLEVILECSTVKSYRGIMLREGILKLLLKVLKKHENDVEFQSLIGQILSNFSLDEYSLNVIYASGWVGILSAWAKSSSVKVNLPALKALANLDKDDVFHCKYDEGIYLLNPVVKQRCNDVHADVIFIHGLRGATFWTWRQHDSALQVDRVEDIDESDLSQTGFGNCSYTWCWPKDWLADDLRKLRLLAIDYHTCVSNWRCKCPPQKDRDSIEAKSKDLIRKLLLANVGTKPIVWIAHSMGGLIVKQMLMDAYLSEESQVNLLSKNTVGIIFFSVPHKGSEIASLLHFAAHLLLPSIHMTELQKETPNLLQLHENFKDFIFQNKVAVLSFGEMKKSSWGMKSAYLVSPESSDPGFGDFYLLPVEHLNTCKPLTRNSIIYIKTLEFLISHVPGLSLNMFSQKYISKFFEFSKDIVP